MSLEEKLLVTREPLRLKRTAGRVEVHKSVPEFLRESALVCWPGFKNASRSCELVGFLPSGKAFLTPEEVYPDSAMRGLDVEGVLAYWSGGRSCLVEDPESGKLFRLKGIAFDDFFCTFTYKQLDNGKSELDRIEGGQFLQSARYEKQFSHRFNRLLAEEGIAPVMQYRGRYVYPHYIPGNYKMAAPLFEVAGDTRLDELTYALTQAARQYDSFFAGTPRDAPGRTAVREFYRAIGFVVGRLKKLMDRSGMTWGDSLTNSNAHVGNIVLYPANERQLAVNLVDFDASCDRSELSAQELRELRAAEKAILLMDGRGDVLSMRKNTSYVPLLFFASPWNLFNAGFLTGYAQSLRKRVVNLVDRASYDTLIKLIQEAREEDQPLLEKHTLPETPKMVLP